MPAEIPDFLAINDFKTRPNTSDGVWVLFLLPLSLLVSTIKHPIIATPTYKLASLIATGLLLTSAIISFQKYRKQRLKIVNSWTTLVLLLTSVLFHVCFHKDWLFSVLSGVVSTLIYFKTYIFLLNKFERCFTFGEAGLISQSIILLIYLAGLNIINYSQATYGSQMQISTLIIQVGLLGIGIIAVMVYNLNVRSVKAFYFSALTVVTFTILLPLHILLDTSPVLWILNEMFRDLSTLKLIIYWSFCTGIAVLAVSNQIVYARKASTGVRKIFHLLAVAVYVPGLLYRCSFIYLASGVVLGVFLVFEILRILHMPPLGPHLQDGFTVFSDEKDTGILALTPIYLLAGCSLPLWIHPSPCDVTDSAMFNLTPLLSGLLSIGVGDTAASIVGSNYGKYHWPGSKKTIEGTLACIFAQISLIYILIYFDCLQNLPVEQYTKLYISIFVASMVEARTTQIDNLVLPLLMYIMLI